MLMGQVADTSELFGRRAARVARLRARGALPTNDGTVEDFASERRSVVPPAKTASMLPRVEPLLETSALTPPAGTLTITMSPPRYPTYAPPVVLIEQAAPAEESFRLVPEFTLEAAHAEVARAEFRLGRSEAEVERCVKALQNALDARTTDCAALMRAQDALRKFGFP